MCVCSDSRNDVPPVRASGAVKDRDETIKGG